MIFYYLDVHMFEDECQCQLSLCLSISLEKYFFKFFSIFFIKGFVHFLIFFVCFSLSFLFDLEFSPLGSWGSTCVLDLILCPLWIGTISYVLVIRNTPYTFSTFVLIYNTFFLSDLANEFTHLQFHYCFRKHLLDVYMRQTH